MRLSKETADFQNRLGYSFRDPGLLVSALTHPSLAGPSRPSNQRLEFLGDRILNLIVAEALFNADQVATEGVLAPRYNALVRKETCAELAAAIGVGTVLRLGRTETVSGGRRKRAALADALEAVIAAVYLDGGYAEARRVVLALYGGRIDAVPDDAKDSKSALQEWAQARGQPLPDYVEISRSGPSHALVFTVEARLTSGETATASAPTKRAAEQAAAKTLLDRLEG